MTDSRPELERMAHRVRALEEELRAVRAQIDINQRLMLEEICCNECHHLRHAKESADSP